MADERTHKTDAAEILHGRISMLEKENQCLKNEIKNEQVVIEMLITNDEWKTMKIKSKNNTNIASLDQYHRKILRQSICIIDLIT